MTTYLLHLVDRSVDKLLVQVTTHPYHVDFVYQVLMGPYAGQRGTVDELQELIDDDLQLLPATIGVGSEDGLIVERPMSARPSTVQPTRQQQASPLLRREVGGKAVSLPGSSPTTILTQRLRRRLNQQFTVPT